MTGEPYFSFYYILLIFIRHSVSLCEIDKEYLIVAHIPSVQPVSASGSPLYSKLVSLKFYPQIEAIVFAISVTHTVYPLIVAPCE